ncbi:MAG: SMC family ATPase [archaeon]
MRFKRIKLTNIRSYENLDVTFPEGKLLLSGDIGSGKTTILLAIEFALFGLQPGQKGLALLRNGADSADVLLEIEVNGKEIIIERGLKRGSKSIGSDYCAITLDGERSDLSVTELKTKIIEILGYPPEFIKKNNLLYRYTIYTPQEQMKQIILEDSELRLNVLRHVFGIERYKNMRENLDVLLIHLKDKLKTLQIELKSLENDKSKIKELVIAQEDLQKKIFTEEEQVGEKTKFRKLKESELKDIEKKIKEKENLEKEVEKAIILLNSKKETLSSAKKELDEAEKNIAEAEKFPFDQIMLDTIVEQIAIKRQETDRLNNQLIEISGKISSSDKESSVISIKKENIFKIDLCPTCLQDVPDFHKLNILNEMDTKLTNLKKDLINLKEQKIEIDKTIQQKRAERTTLEQRKLDLEIAKSRLGELGRWRKKRDEISKQKDSLEKDISLLNKHFDSLKENISMFSKFAMAYKIKEDDLKKAFISERNAEILVAELKKELELTQKEALLLERIISTKESDKKKMSELSELIDWLSNKFISLLDFTERNVLIKLRTEFAKLFSKWFRMLAGDSFEVQLDENFTPLIMQGDAEMEYDFLSGGERTAIALAYRLALNQTINSIMSTIRTRDIIVLDEPTDGFSEIQLDKVREVLDELKIGQIIIVSHEQKIESFVDQIIKLKKEGSVSSPESQP